MLRRRFAFNLLLFAMLGIPTGLAAQVPEAPVRYEDDFLGAEFHRGRRGAVAGDPPRDAVPLFLCAGPRSHSKDVNIP